MAQTPSTQTPTDPTLMAYDLRARYAQIVGDILEEIAIARDKREFPKWFSLLEDLHTEISQKLSNTEKTEWKEELEKCIETINQNKSSYNGSSQNGEKKYMVYNSIKDLDMWLRDKMETHKMFGATGERENL